MPRRAVMRYSNERREFVLLRLLHYRFDLMVRDLCVLHLMYRGPPFFPIFAGAQRFRFILAGLRRFALFGRGSGVLHYLGAAPAHFLISAGKSTFFSP